MTIDEQPVAIEGVVGKDFFLQLNRPASLGTPVSFAYWLKDNYDVRNLDVMLPSETYKTSADFKTAYRNYKSEIDKDKREAFQNTIKTHLGAQGIPTQLQKLLTTALLAELTITDLLIDIRGGDGANIPAKKKMMFGLSVGFPDPLPLLPNIDVNKVSILIMNAPADDFTFPKRVELPSSVPLPVEAARATGSITFSDVPADQSTITLGGDTWTFGSGGPSGNQVAPTNSLEGTLVSLASALNAASASNTAKCKYVANADEKRLEITYKTVGVIGNDFIIAAGANSNGTPSGPTLRGGANDEQKKLEKPSGWIKFSSNPAPNSKITLNGVDWKFVKTATTGNPETTIDADLKVTIESLAQGLSDFPDPKIKKCKYVASSNSLGITFEGSAGESFTLGTSDKSNATASPSILTA